MRKVIKSIPNAITCLNLFFGCMAIVSALNGDLVTAFYLMICAAIFDFLDGFAARILNAYSPMGKELDSLADMVSFGVVPSFIVYSMGCEQFAFVIAVFSGLRLAKFNIDTRQTTQFIGLPTPANALFFGSIGYIVQTKTNTPIAEFFTNDYFIYPVTVIFSLLLVSEIPMFSFKFKSYSFAKNAKVYIFLILSIIAIIMFKVTAIPFIVAGYVLLSITEFTFNKFAKS